MQNQDLKKLELDKILAMLGDKCSNITSKNSALALRPSSDENIVRELLLKTNDAYQLSMAFGAPPFISFKDTSSSLIRCKTGGRISLRDILDIAAVLRQSVILSDWYSHCENQENSLNYLFYTITPLNDLLSRIENSVLDDETIADTASPQLLSIRQKIARSGIKLRETLTNMVRNPDVQKCLQDSNITLRDGRYVLPVKSEYRGQIKGLIHDTSSSGQTIFIEPIAVVEANNDIRLLESREAEEIERIINELCSQCGSYADVIMTSFKACTELNLYFAKAELGIDMKAYVPVISDENIIELKKARHPLLDPKTAVGVDISLGNDYNMLIITGPNTGGKTVALKTAGLLTAMAMCGLMIPAAEGSTVAVMNHILADIGDKQSIEASLSTFSSHMTNIASILEKSDRRSLVLLDEPGTGTDPLEGAALAEAVFEELLNRKCLCMATTHYQELKIYAADKENVQNASCEFDPETLKPTYKLRIGSPGKSNAFAIAQGLGFPPHVIEYARNLIDCENSRFEDAAAKLEETQSLLENERAEAEKERIKIKNLRLELESEKAELESNRQKEMERARGAASQIIEQTKAVSNALIDELEQLRREKDKSDFSKKVSDAKSSGKALFNKMYDTANPVDITDNSGYVLPREIKQGDDVYIVPLAKNGIAAGKPDSNGQIFVQVGIMKTKVNIKDIRLVDKPKSAAAPVRQRKKPSSSSSEKKTARSGSMELDIRGYAADEGVYEMEAFIDRAVMSGLHAVTIIHGKGTGVLRNAVRARLRNVSSVKSFRPGVYGEGEDGVTIVELK